MPRNSQIFLILSLSTSYLQLSHSWVQHFLLSSFLSSTLSVSRACLLEPAKSPPFSSWVLSFYSRRGLQKYFGSSKILTCLGRFHPLISSLTCVDLSSFVLLEQISITKTRKPFLCLVLLFFLFSAFNPFDL